ncbi:MAG: polysaccharide biosynthesis/export family protein [Bergeyella zoohelcum]|nr:polysaccharide biosynthesis/export family protein [Bergeyella zoohelcum]
MKSLKLVLLAMVSAIFTSCITQKDISYLQPSESLVINEEGLIPYNPQEYRVTRNDIFNLNIITTPNGDAAQFYSRLNTSGGTFGTSTSSTSTSTSSSSTGGGTTTVGSSGAGSGSFFFNGIKVNANGEIYVFGIGYIKAEGRLIRDIQQEIQDSVNYNFLEGKSEVRLNLDGITYYMLGDIETTGVTGIKKAYVQNINIMEAIAQNGGLNRSIDRTNVVLHRRYPEGIKKVRIDLTREDIMNSPYYWLQNGDMLYFSTRKKSLHGFGKDPLQTLSTGVSLLTTAMTIYLLITRL